MACALSTTLCNGNGVLFTNDTLVWQGVGAIQRLGLPYAGTHSWRSCNRELGLAYAGATRSVGSWFNVSGLKLFCENPMTLVTAVLEIRRPVLNWVNGLIMPALETHSRFDENGSIIIHPIGGSRFRD